MNHPAPHPGLHQRTRRGAAYLYAVTVSVVLMTIAMALVSINRVNARTINQESGITQAQSLARAAVEHTLQTIADNSAWRSVTAVGNWQPELALGAGSISWKWEAVDATTVRIYGRGTVGSVRRLYSVELAERREPLDVLRTAVHSDADIQVTEDITAKGGPVSSNLAVTVQGGNTLDGDVEAPSIFVFGTITGTKTITGVKAMPSSTVFTDLKALATTISYWSLPGGNMKNVVLSPASNPWGAANARGIYFIDVPAGKTLTVDRSRLVATLLVDVGWKSSFKLTNPNSLEPPSALQPCLLITGDSTASITLEGGNKAIGTGFLDESLEKVSFNPPGTPYPYVGGVTDADLLDTYPAQVTGIVHVMCPASVSVQVDRYFWLKGTLISECALRLQGKSLLETDPAMLTDPPDGYVARTYLALVAGSWQWEKDQ